MSSILKPQKNSNVFEKSSIPQSLEGRWQSQNLPAVSSKYIKFSPGDVAPYSRYYIGNDPAEFSVSADGNTLTWAGSTFTRLGGAGQTFIGHWLENCTSADCDHVIFYGDGSYTWHVHGTGFDYQGGVSISTGNAAGGTLNSEELRALCTADNINIYFDPPYGQPETVPYTIVDNVLTMTIGGGSVHVHKVVAENWPKVEVRPLG